MLTTDYINHFGALAMLLEIAPDFPEALGDLLAWQPRSYEAHLHSITFTDPAPLLAAYAALDPAVRGPFDETAEDANRYGARLVALLNKDALPEEERRKLCTIGNNTMSAFIQRMNAMIAGTQAAAHLPDDLQNHIDRLLAEPE